MDEERAKYLIGLITLLIKGVVLYLAYRLIISGHPWFGVLFLLGSLTNVTISY